MSTERISRSPNSFNNYITNTDAYNTAGTPNNGTRLGLSSTNISDWHAKHTSWAVLYTKYIDPTQRTTSVNADIHLAIKNFRLFANPLLDVIAASPALTNADADMYNVVMGHAAPTHPTTPIADNVVLNILPKGGGLLQVSAHPDSSASGRAHKPEGANAVELAFAYGNTPPTGSPDDENIMKEISTKAQFVHHAESHVGEKMYCWARWVNISYPNFNGPWCSMITVVVA